MSLIFPLFLALSLTLMTLWFESMALGVKFYEYCKFLNSDGLKNKIFFWVMFLGFFIVYMVIILAVFGLAK